MRWPRVPETSTCQCSWRLLSEKWQADSGVPGDLHPPCPRSAGQAGCPKYHRQQNTSVSKSFRDSSDQWENFSCLNIGTYIWCLLFEIHLTQAQRAEVSTDLTTYPPSLCRCLPYTRPSSQAALDISAIDLNPVTEVT